MALTFWQPERIEFHQEMVSTGNRKQRNIKCSVCGPWS